MTESLQVQLLGEFRVFYHGEPATILHSARLQALLAYLALHRSAPQSRQQLAYLFWPDSSDSQARTNLRNALFQLRGSLPDAASYVQIDAQTVQWRPDSPCALDVADFEDALNEARQATLTAHKRRALERAVACYTGDLLPGFYDDWVLAAREQLQQQYLGALDQLIDLLEAERDYRNAIAQAQRLLQHDPLRESAYARLMQLYAQAGDRAAALRVYHTCTTTLARELGVDPDPVTQRIYEHLLNLESPQPAISRLPDASPLVGREQPWRALQKAWQHAARGHPSVVLVTGEAGIGKTRLVEEFAQWTQRQGVATSTTHCYAVGGASALAPVQAWLRAPALQRARKELAALWATEVARLLPELLIERPDLSPPAPLIESWQRQRLFEALAQLLLHSNEPLLLALDDIQWCDSDTLEWLHFLLRFRPAARLMVVCTLRQEPNQANPALAALLHQLGRADQLRQIDLLRLTADETAQLAANLLGREIDTEMAHMVYHETEGNPLFVVETVRAATQPVNESDPQADGSSAPAARPSDPAATLPPRVLAVIQARLDALSPTAYTLGSVAAVIGRAFSVDVLAHACETSADALVQALDELWQQRIIREQRAPLGAAESYDFTHDKLREVAYAALSPVRRRYLHRRIAQTLLAVHHENLAGVHAQVAVHWEAGGQPQRAMEAYIEAAQAAHQRSTLNEAIDHLHRALALVATFPATEQRPAELRIQAALGPLLLATKGYAAPEVEQAFTRAWELCHEHDDAVQRFQVLWGLGRFYTVQPNPTRGQNVSQQLMTLAQATGDSGLLLEAHCALGTHYFHRAALSDARHHLTAAITAYDPQQHVDHRLSYGQDPCVVASAYLAWTLWCMGHPAEALAHTEAALSLARTLAHPYSQVIALTYAAVQQQFLQQPEACLAYAGQSIALADRYGFTLWLSMATFLRGWAQTTFGNFDAGFDDMQCSIDLFRQTGAELGAAYFTALLAETFGRAGQPDVGLLLMTQALDQLARTEDRWCESELYRLQGELFALNGQPPAAEEAFRTAITVAQSQQAGQWELRAVVSLARLLQPAGRLDAVRGQLQSVVVSRNACGATPELTAARELLLAG